MFDYSKHAPRAIAAACLVACGVVWSASACAQVASTGGKLLLTGGVSEIDGAAGGGLTPWALIGGQGTAGQVGGNVHDTYVKSGAYALNSVGGLFGIADRFEFSVAHQSFDTRDVGAELGLGEGYRFSQDIIGAKVRVLGNAVLDQDVWWPQVSVGIQYKHNNNANIVEAIGAKSDSGTDFYISATKLLLAQSLLINGTLRLTKANQLGLLGFGGDRNDSYRPEFETSIAYLLSKQIAIGAEYRMKPDNLSFAREQDWYDAFVAWQPNKYVSLTVAYVQLGDIATIRNQHGFYVSGQLGF
ncbi:DUF3034 family protein [Pararobbsia alpina]|jgi:hypothetical protein|uniref:DUF3034 family protein n=1 Tax=Pararobbsia alpina TaxID=621374 RepID=UPI0039A4C2B0